MKWNKNNKWMYNREKILMMLWNIKRQLFQKEKKHKQDTLRRKYIVTGI